MLFLSEAIFLSLLFVSFGQSKPIEINRGQFKIALVKDQVHNNTQKNQVVSFLAKQKQTAYNHGSGKLKKEPFFFY